MSADVVKKLRIAGGQRVLVLNADDGLKRLLSDLPGDARMVDTGEADAVVLFARDSSALKEHVGRAVQAAAGDRLLWICYPKKGTPEESDLSRDQVRELTADTGVEAVSQIALDSTWSALRFRPVR